MFIRVNAIENLDATTTAVKEPMLLNVNDIFSVTQYCEPDGSSGPGDARSCIEMRGMPRAGSEYPRVQLLCEESIDEIQEKIRQALLPQRSSTLPSRRQAPHQHTV